MCRGSYDRKTGKLGGPPPEFAPVDAVGAAAKARPSTRPAVLEVSMMPLHATMLCEDLEA